MMIWTWFITAEKKRIIFELLPRTFLRGIIFWKTSLLCSLLLIGCQSNDEIDRQYFSWQGNEIWYTYQGNSEQIPLVLIHGGPGMTSHYMEPFLALADSVPILMYDQLGSGRSTIPTDTSLYNIDYYIEELEALRKNLGLEKLHVLGHSWGGFLALSYYARYPKRVSKLILSSPLIEVDRWLHDADSLKKLLPYTVQSTLNEGLDSVDSDNEEYLSAVQLYYDNYFITKPHPLMDSTFKYMGLAVYNYMWGSTEFVCAGTLQGESRLAVLPEISIPTLFTAGSQDECPPLTLKSFASHTPNAQLHIFKNAGHMTMLESTRENLKVVYTFLKD